MRKRKEKMTSEYVQLNNKPEEEEKNILLKLIELFVSKRQFKEYLRKNIAAL